MVSRFEAMLTRDGVFKNLLYLVLFIWVEPKNLAEIGLRYFLTIVQ